MFLSCFVFSWRCFRGATDDSRVYHEGTKDTKLHEANS
jgi:hypothetical protein